jgi:hypothetical protein
MATQYEDPECKCVMASIRRNPWEPAATGLAGVSTSLILAALGGLPSPEPGHIALAISPLPSPTLPRIIDAS